MNNKGQVLVLFVLLIPVLLLAVAFVIDTGLLYEEKKHIEDSIKEGISYGLNNIESKDLETRIKRLITKNIEDIKEIIIDVNNDYLEINVKKDYKGLFSVLFKNNVYEIDSTYYGYINDQKLIINKG